MSLGYHQQPTWLGRTIHNSWFKSMWLHTSHQPAPSTATVGVESSVLIIFLGLGDILSENIKMSTYSMYVWWDGDAKHHSDDWIPHVSSLNEVVEAVWSIEHCIHQPPAAAHNGSKQRSWWGLHLMQHKNLHFYKTKNFPSPTRLGGVRCGLVHNIISSLI